MREFIDRKSFEDGLSVSRLPQFTEDEKRMINGSADFLGFNHVRFFFVSYEILFAFFSLFLVAF